MPRSLVFALIAALLGFAAIGFVKAQESPTVADSAACASPAASPASGSVAEATVSPSAMASPAASPCASPAAGGQASASPAVDLLDIKFDPRTFTIAADTDVTVTLTNKGAAVHNFNIDELGIHSGDVQPGASATVKINAKPGKYVYYCNIPGHKDAGMVGQLTIQ